MVIEIYMKLADDEAEVQTLFKIDAEIVGSISRHESDQSAAAVSTISNQNRYHRYDSDSGY